MNYIQLWWHYYIYKGGGGGEMSKREMFLKFPYIRGNFWREMPQFDVSWISHALIYQWLKNKYKK